MNNGRKWTKEEDFLVSKLYQSIGAKNLAKDLDRTVQAVQKRASKLGVTKNVENPWTEKEIVFLETEYCFGTDLEDIIEKLGRSKLQVRSKISYLNLKRPKVWLDCEDEFLITERKNKTPYKKIALRLDKTVNACYARFGLLKNKGKVI